ncbi:MAG: transporter substrate-binding domain-containing protein [Bacteriovorax sp.]|nr:transporter substrate-binding domain-containing protein [Bacteriovorax sp.]
MNTLKISLFLLGLLIFSNSKACEVKIGWEPWVPYQVKQASGQPVGLDVELLQAVLTNTGCTPKFIELPWARQLVESEIGSIDIVMGASKSPERKKYANFSLGYRNEISTLFVKVGSGSDIKKVSDLATTKLKLGAVKGNLYSPEIDAMISKFDASANNDETNLKKFLANRIDGFIADRYTGTNLIKEAHASGQIIQHPLNISTSEVYFMVSKKSKVTDLTNKLSASIKKLKANKALTNIIHKYE